MKKSFLKFFNTLAIVGLVISTIAFTSCGDDDGDDGDMDPTQTVWEIVESNSSLGSLEAELLAADLDGALGTSQDITLFAPTDAALNVLLGTLGLEDFSSINPEIATAVLTYHVATSVVNSGDLNEGNNIATLQGENITVGDSNGPILISGATTDASFTTTDIQATNGVVHIIDVVLVPPTVGAQIVATLNTLAQPVLLGADFTILAEGIAKADDGKPDEETILNALINETDLTVFAPSNATFFSAAGVVEGDDQETIDSKVETAFGNLTGVQWDAIIRNHVVVGQGVNTNDDDDTLGPADLTTGATYNTLGGGSLLFFNNTDMIEPDNGIGIFIDGNGDVDLDNQSTLMNFDAEVAVPDAVNIPTQGRIHVIAGILDPTPPAN